MSYKAKIKAAFKPAQPGTPTLAEICPAPLSKTEIAARRRARELQAREPDTPAFVAKKVAAAA